MRNLVNMAAVAGMTLVVASTVVINVSGWGRQSAAESVAAAPVDGCTGPEWAGVSTGRKFRDNKRVAQQQRASTASFKMANEGDFAYGSRPVDVSAPGTYSFLFGPVPATFVPGKSPAGLAFAFPPDFSANMVVAGDPKPGIVVRDGVRYFEQAFVIDTVKTPCSTLVAWIY
jgi:hypothetical protein